MTGLEKLSTRRDKRQVSFAKKCISNKFTSKLFPRNPIDRKEKFKVNYASTSAYYNSAVPQCQRMLNEYYMHA